MSDLVNTSTEFEPITSQDELNRIVSARVTRERAKYADYDEIKAQAAKAVADLEAANAAHEAKLAELEAAKAASEAEALKLSVAADKGVPAKLLTGSTKEDLEAAAEALLEFKGGSQESHAQHNGPLFGLDGADAFATRDVEARGIFGL